MRFLSRSCLFAALLVAASVGSQGGSALANSASTGTRPPDAPTQLATEYPQPEPVLHGIFSDPDGGSGRVLYTVFDLGGTVVLHDEAGQTVSSGSDSPLIIRAGNLVGGVRYGWTARSSDGTSFSAPTTEPDFVEASVSSVALGSRSASDPDPDVDPDVGLNPWGCVLKVLNPHSSPPNIKAEGQTNCVTVPSNVNIEHSMNLYRSSWHGWIFVAYNDSWCDAGTHSSGQPYPQCHSLWTAPRMQGYVWWACVNAGHLNDWYNYLVTDDSRIYHYADTYGVHQEKQTGNWNENGTVQCRN